ncbi:glycosyltransferase family 2 protein [Sphingobacterium hungaricum]|uniref:Glycosyltransferase 2-like domain-containing protein n=1 Tax=Sphingobacterium hungaricum TaxID=2082723 RepID=A0A928UTC0_9SPHI|nr:glycosyltransferase family 2 protein [Sphingobacterium hungaricum]MBE8712357.1 hypothetical protein [Sphingobacterium hungaricum]
MINACSNFTVSVIVPIFNVEKYLEKGILSLFNQTLDGLEFIFVDDCSTDNSFQVLTKLIDSNKLGKSIQVVRHEKNMGVATARNTGLRLARGKYLASMDPDDWIEPDMLEKMYLTAEREKAEIVWCDYYNDYKSHEDYISQKVNENSGDCIEGMLTGKLLGGMCNRIVLHDLFLRNNITYPDGFNMCEDLNVCVQLYYYAKKVRHVDEAFYHYTKYRNESISLTSTGYLNVNEGWIENVKSIERFLIGKGFSNLNVSISLLKLAPKQNLLVKGNNISFYKKWREIFPESNKYIWNGDLPLHYKIIASNIIKDNWLIPKLWLFLKKVSGKF